MTKAERQQREKQISENALNALRLARQAYYAEQKRLDQEFWRDADEELGVTIPHSVRLVLQEKAQSEGHASGYSDVFNHYCDLIDLYHNIVTAQKEAGVK